VSRETSLLAPWPYKRIEAECRRPYAAYHRDVRERHLSYFEEELERRHPRNAFGALSLAAALPRGWQRLERFLPPERRHRHHLSGGSSQVLALGLLGPAVMHDAMLPWLFEPEGFFPSIGQPVSWEFEYSVGFGLLNERPKTTDIDLFVSGPDAVVALEAKFTERGLGRCSCKERDSGRCDKRVFDRPYWDVGTQFIGLDPPNPPGPCQLSVAYQAVRNVAAVLEMSGLRHGSSAFGLLYDARNPYFAGAGKWPGWASILESTLDASRSVSLLAISWQSLIPRLPRRGRGEVFRWAADKHGLTAA
jgi:hypothetical protein